jgi:hypothetical protein
MRETAIHNPTDDVIVIFVWQNKTDTRLTLVRHDKLPNPDTDVEAIVLTDRGFELNRNVLTEPRLTADGGLFYPHQQQAQHMMSAASRQCKLLSCHISSDGVVFPVNPKRYSELSNMGFTVTVKYANLTRGAKTRCHLCGCASAYKFGPVGDKECCVGTQLEVCAKCLAEADIDLHLNNCQICLTKRNKGLTSADVMMWRRNF